MEMIHLASGFLWETVLLKALEKEDSAQLKAPSYSAGKVPSQSK